MKVNKRPLVSIILPVYNGEAFLAQSLQSCIDQTHQNLEIIIVNDCSTDTSLSIAEAFAESDPRIKIINNEKNLKLPASLNAGHYAAKGEYISWTSDDNMFQSNAIEKLLENLLNSKCDISFSAYQIIDKDGATKREVQPLEDVHILFGNCIGASFLYKKAAFTRNDGYNENLHTVEDYDFWLRASVHSTFCYLKDILYQYRLHDGSLTAAVSGVTSPSQLRFEQNLKRAYASFFDEAESLYTTELTAYVYSLSRIQEIDMVAFFKQFDRFKHELEIVLGDTSNSIFNDVWESLDLRIRLNLLTYPANQNFKTLSQIIRRRPQLLLKYDRRRSLKYILSCLR